MKRGRLLFSIALAAAGVLAVTPLASATHGQPHATIKTWAIGADQTLGGLDPHQTIDDVTGLNGHVGAPAMVTAMENGGFGFCGFLYWNPNTNEFVEYKVTGGFNYAVDMNRGPVAPAGFPARTFGGGDAWSAVNGNASYSPYVNFRGTDDFRRWSLGSSQATGVVVNSANGKVYLGDFAAPGRIIELDPATNAVRTWTIGNKPYGLVLQGSLVWATAVADGGKPDEVVRLNPDTGEITRWAIPGGGLQSSVTFGTPDSITIDEEGNVWLTESASSEVARLRVAANAIDEFSEVGADPDDQLLSMRNPHAIATSGRGSSLQAFFTEGSAGALQPGISLLTTAQGTPLSTGVAPTTETLVPVASTATPTDFTIEPLKVTVTPSTFDSEAPDATGIVRFPIPGDTSQPTGMTRVAIPQTVFGSMEGSNHVFQLTSEAIIAPALTQADLSVTKADTPDPVTTGGQVTYTMTVKNDGPAEATNVTLTDTLPAGTTLVSATASQGSCTGTTCNLGTLASGASATVTIVVTANQAGTITNTASVSATESDPNLANNTASATTSVAAFQPPPTVVPVAAAVTCQVNLTTTRVYAGLKTAVKVKATRSDGTNASGVNVTLAMGSKKLTAKTNANGVAQFTVTGAKNAQIKVTASGGCGDDSLRVTTANNCSGIAVSPRSLVVGESKVVLIRARLFGKPLANTRIVVRGPGISARGRTDAGGNFSATVTGSGAGQVTVSAPDVLSCSRRIGVTGAFAGGQLTG